MHFNIVDFINFTYLLSNFQKFFMVNYAFFLYQLKINGVGILKIVNYEILRKSLVALKMLR